MHRICLTPHTTTGGIASFRLKFTAGAEEKGVSVTENVKEKNVDAALVIGGTKNIPALLRFRRMGIPVVQRLNGMNWVHKARRTGLRHTLRSIYGNTLLNFIRTHIATHIIYQSQFSKDWWHREYGPAPLADTIIYNGVDLDQYSPIGAQTRPIDRYRLLVVEGSLAGGYDFGLTNAINLVGHLQKISPLPVELVVASKVPLEIQSYWDQHTPIPLTWAGFVPREAIPELDRSAHAMFPPDPNAACPNSVIEALACGLPVIAFETGSLPELVADGAGVLTPYAANPWLLETPDTARLATAGLAVFTNNEPYRFAARRRAEQLFSLTAMVDQYLAVLIN